MKDKEIQFLLTLKDQLTAKWQSVTDKMKSGMRGMVDTFKATWVAISAGAFAAFTAIKTGFEWMEGWAKGEVMAGAFRATLKRMGLDSEAEFAKIKTAAAGMIDEDTLTEMSNRWLSMGMDIRQMSDVLQLARIKARETGTDMQDAFTRLSEALSLGKEKGLKALGIAVDSTDAYKKYAASLGITVQQLTDVQKKQAVLNAALESGKKSAEGMDLATKTLNEQISTYKAKIEEMKDFGGMVFYRLMLLLYGSVQAVWNALLQVGSAFTQLFYSIAQAADKVGIPLGSTFKKIADDMQQYAADAKKSMNDTFDAMMGKFNDADLAGPIISAADSVTRAVGDMYNRAQKTEEISAAKSVKTLADSLSKRGVMIKQYVDSVQVQTVQEYDFVRGLTDDMIAGLDTRMNVIMQLLQGTVSAFADAFTGMFQNQEAVGKSFLKSIVLMAIDVTQALIMAASAAALAKGVMTFGFSTMTDLPLILAATAGLQLLRAFVAEKFHDGGVVPKMGGSTYVNGPPSSERLVLVRGGETIRTEDQEAALRTGGMGGSVVINVNGPVADARSFKEIIEKGMRETGITDAAQYFRNSRSNLVLQS